MTGSVYSCKDSIIVQLLRALTREKATTVIQVTHNPEMARLSDAGLTLRDGRLQE